MEAGVSGTLRTTVACRQKETLFFLFEKMHKHALCIQRILCFVCARKVRECIVHECTVHERTVSFGSGREGGTHWGDQCFLLKWLRYRPEHDVKLLIKRWE